MNTLALFTLTCGLAALTLSPTYQDSRPNAMKLGTFSVCLTVKDIRASKAFYEKLDFKEVAGDVKKRWVVMQNETTKIALFQGLLERTTLTFNPGVDYQRQTLKDFQDVRELQHILKERGLKLTTEADEKGDGPASFTLADPDGNPIYFDQGVPRPKR